MQKVMDASEFRRRGKEMVDYVADYLENIRERPPVAQVEPGYLRPLVPDEAPEEPEKWEEVFKDIERVIMPGVTHWHNPEFHAYFPTGSSYASNCADMLSDAIGCLGFSWFCSPACTELEMVVLDWLGKAIGLPSEFLSGGKGGGVIQGSASEATLLTLLVARIRSINHLGDPTAAVNGCSGCIESEECHHQGLVNGNGLPSVEKDSSILSRMVVYCSDQTHASIERAALLGAVRCHKVESDERDCLRGPALQKAIDEDRANGLIPFYCVATLGTTATCAFDDLLEIGPICNYREKLWLHIDAAYAGAAFICPEFRHLLNGVEHVSLAKEFETLVRCDDRFQVINDVRMGLVSFRLNGGNDVLKTLMEFINSDGRIHIMPSESKGNLFLRFCVCASRTESSDIHYSWKVIQELVDKVTRQDHKQ